MTTFRPLVVEQGPRYREAAYAAIKEAILSGRFAPGQPLIEEHIAAELQISRTPVRESLAILQHEHLLAPRSGRGLYVREVTREEFVAMFVANETVEPYLVRQAARLATPEQLAQIAATLEQGEQAAERQDIGGLLRSGRDFHRLVGVAADNQPLTRFVSDNEERADLYLLGYERISGIERLRASNHEHNAIFRAIAERDPETAVRLVIYHSQSVRERMSWHFTSETEGAARDRTTWLSPAPGMSMT